MGFPGIGAGQRIDFMDTNFVRDTQGTLNVDSDPEGEKDDEDKAACKISFKAKKKERDAVPVATKRYVKEQTKVKLEKDLNVKYGKGQKLLEKMGGYKVG